MNIEGLQSATITGLYVYPVKSMRGIAVPKARLSSTGLSYDRHWMVIDANQKFVTQRQCRQLALVVPTLATQGLVLTGPKGESLTIPYEMPQGKERVTEVWGDECLVIDEGDEVSAWLTACLESDSVFRLVRMRPDAIRPQSEPDEFGKDTHVMFADAGPLLVANEASLASVNAGLIAKGESAVPMNRFRPNIVLSGLAPFAEHKMMGLSGKDFELRFCAPCTRCVMTTIDQETAQRHPAGEPFKTLRAINPLSESDNQPVFGHYTVVYKGAGSEIFVGGPLQIQT